MIDLARLPLVSQASSQTADQSVAPVSRLQQQGSAIGAALPLIELQYSGLGKNLREQQTFCRGKVDHAEASFVSKHCLDNMFLAQEAFAFSTFKNYVG
jgi:hypothetical protein